MKKITTISYKIGNMISTRLHLKGEVKLSDLTYEVAKDFEDTTKEVLQNTIVDLGNDVSVEVEVNDVDDNDIILLSTIDEFDETHIKNCVFARMILAAK